jgi:cytochrome b
MDTPTSGTPRPILVWDAPVRVFHWLLVASFFGAYLTAESERWRLVHVTLGYTVGGLVAFRVLWGLFGTRYARFAGFVRGPRAVWTYLQSMLSRRPEHHTGHNPAGAAAIVAMLLLAGVTVGFGYATYNELGGEWLAKVHETAGNLMLAVVGVHVAGVLLGSWLHRENLVRAMVTGRKLGRTGEAIRRGWGALAAVLLAAVLGFWALAWRDAPAAGGADAPAHAEEQEKSEHSRATAPPMPRG